MSTAAKTSAHPNSPPPGVVVPESREESASVLVRRWRKFKSMKRGWYSFLILLSLYALSLLNPLLINQRALIVSHQGELRFPAVTEWFTDRLYAAKDLGQRAIGECNYRKLKEQYDAAGGDDWVLLAPYPFGPNESLMEELEGRPPHPPQQGHWLGTDDRGRDVFARLAYGFRISISFALLVVFLDYLIGVAAGATLGFFGGRVDFYGQRLVEIWAAIPFLYTVIIIESTLKPGLFMLAVLLALFGWVGISYYMRGEFYREKAKDYVAAAIAQGESRMSIMFTHILPNSLTPIISFAPFAIVGSITALVSLDFLGFGLQPPTPSWGELVNQGKQNIQDWHLVTFPLAALFATLMLVVFIGEAVREAFDPKTYSRLR
ncbi:MAG: ABC transporter permease subunit [Planctomycetes bacterium]|nr:ABC transporter permease subunit [Planctomycetota bacterium]